MAKGKINLNELDRMLRDGLSYRQIAKHFNCTPGAIAQARKKLKNNIVRTIGLEKANEVVEGHLNMLGQLRKINRAITEELDRAKEEVAAFQQIVLEEIGNVAPEVRDRILHRLNERRAIRSTLDFSKHPI